LSSVSSAISTIISILSNILEPLIEYPADYPCNSQLVIPVRELAITDRSYPSNAA
jgi:hypothetical protein